MRSKAAYLALPLVTAVAFTVAIVINGGGHGSRPVPIVSTARPVVTGTATVGQTLSCSQGRWTSPRSITGYAYKWQDSANGTTGWANIASATSSSYVIGSGESSKYGRCAVTASASGGRRTVAYSKPTAQISAGGTNLANIWVGAAGSCTRSATAVAYDAATSCDSSSQHAFSYAYLAMRNGDLGMVRAGTLPGQLIGYTDGTNTNLTSQVTLEAEPGSTVTLSGDNWNNGYRLQIYEASHLKIAGMTLASAANIEGGSGIANDDTYDGLSAARVEVIGHVTNATVSNGNFDATGQCSVAFGSPQPGIIAESNGYQPSTVTIADSRFHDETTCDTPKNSLQHSECFQALNPVGTITIIRSKFYNCDSTGNFTANSIYGATWVIEQNWWGCGGDGSIGAALPYDTGNTVTARFNSGCKYMGTNSTFPPGATWIIYGNYGPYSANLCAGTNTYNLSVGGHCAGTGNATVSTLDFVDSSTQDFHLAPGANAIDQCGSSGPSTDAYGVSRPLGAAFDCGASEKA